jgi:hypothetical protein
MMRERAAGVHTQQHQLVFIFFNFHSSLKTKGNNQTTKEEEVNDMSVHLFDALHTGNALFLI